MRDILNLLDNLLAEANLGAPEILSAKSSSVPNPSTGKLYTRPELFLAKVKNGSPFTLVSGGEVVIDPSEAVAVAQWITSGPKGPKGSITLRTQDGGTIKNTQLLKTVEFGSKEAENIKIKGSDVFDTEDIDIQELGNSMDAVLAAGGFPASEMYSKIAENPQLQAMGKLGDAVIYLAHQANLAQVPTIPKDLTADQVKAIELYASEYIGALGLVTGGVPFLRGTREDFEGFVGGTLSDMIMFFPKSVSNPLADSFSIVNDESGHAVKISSKAAGKGAAPSLGSMKLPDDIRKKYPEAAKFIDLAQDPKITTFVQPFALINYVATVGGDIPKEYASLMPFDLSLISSAESSMKNNKPLPRKIMKTFEKRLSPKMVASTAPDGGKIWWAVIQDLIKIVNEGTAIPNFKEALIESLGYNFVQLYTNVKGNVLETKAFWPAKISGQVKLKTKGSAGEMKGKISVEISPSKTDFAEPEEVPTRPSKAKTSAADSEKLLQKRSKVKAGGEPDKLGTEKALGRRRQR